MFELYQHLYDNEFNRKEQIDNKIGMALTIAHIIKNDLLLPILCIVTK